MKALIINILPVFFLFFLLLSACKSNSDEALYQKWRTLKIQNNKLDQQIAEMRSYIDTVGNEDKEIHKATDVAALKKILQADLDKSMQDQQIAFDNTFMEFKKNNIMITTSTDGVDSVMFSKEKNIIKADDSKLKGYGESMTFEILSLKPDTLILKLVDYGDTSIATMIPVKK